MRTLAERREVNLGPKGSPLMIALDARYPGIVEAAEDAIRAAIPGIATRRHRPKDNLVRVVASSSAWVDAFSAARARAQASPDH